MANETKNAQEYVGKVIVVGDNMATIEIKDVQDNGMLSCEFKKGDYVTKMPVTIPNLEAMMKRGVWKFQDDTKAESEPVQTTPTEDCSIKTQSPNSGGETNTSEDDVEEVQDVVPPTPKPKKTEEPKGKAKEVKMGTQKSQKSQKESAAKAETKTEPKPKTKTESAGVQTTPTPPNSGGEAAALVYETYTSSKGKACARILGFKADDAAYKNAIELHGSASWMNTKQGKVLYLSFGHKYVEKAKALCDALNEGKTLADCKAIIDGEGAKGSGTSAPKTYTLEEVAAKLKKLLPEGDKASVEDIKKLLEAA